LHICPSKQLPSSSPFRGLGGTKKGHQLWQPFCIVKKTNMELPYDYPLRHHQPLFIVFKIIYGTNMEFFF
jgi:hypothetical protein